MAKGHGTIRACTQCRTRKVKCDGRDPCSQCSRKGVECTYQNQTQRRGPKPRRRLHFMSSSISSAKSNLTYNPQSTSNVPNADLDPDLTSPPPAPLKLSHFQRKIEQPILMNRDVYIKLFYTTINHSACIYGAFPSYFSLFPFDITTSVQNCLKSVPKISEKQIQLTELYFQTLHFQFYSILCLGSFSVHHQQISDYCRDVASQYFDFLTIQFKSMDAMHLALQVSSHHIDSVQVRTLIYNHRLIRHLLSKKSIPPGHRHNTQLKEKLHELLAHFNDELLHSHLTYFDTSKTLIFYCVIEWLRALCLFHMVELRMNQGGPPLRTQLESIMFQISPVLRLRMVTQSFQSKDTPFSFLYSDSEPPPQQFFNESVVTDLLDRISELRTILQTDPTSPTPQVLPPQTNVTFDIHPASIPKQDESEAPSGSTALSKQKSLLGAFFEHLSFQDIINQFMKFYVFTQRIPESWRLPAFPTLLRLSGKVFHFLASDTDSTTDVKISNELMSIVCHFTSVLNVSPSPHFMQDLLMRTDLVTLTSDARSALVNSFVTLQKLLETKGAVERKRVAKVPVQRLIQPEVKKPDETGAGKRSLPFQFTINTEDTTMKHIISLTQHFETEQKENVEEESEEIIETISLSILRSPDSVDKTEIDRILELPMIVPQPVIDSPPTIPTLHELISSTLPHPTALSAETQFDLASLQELFLADDNLIFFLDTFEGRLKSSRACCTVPMTTPLPLTTQSLRVHPQQSFDLYMLANYHVLLSLFFLIEGLVSESLYAAVTASNNIHDYVLERGLSDYVNRGMGIGLVVFLFHIVSHTFLPQLGPDENSFRNTPGFGEPGSSTHMWKHMDASKSMMSWKQPIDKLINLFSSPPPFAPSAQDLPPGSVTEHRKKLSAQLLVTMPPQTVVGLFRALLILTRVLSIFSIIQPHISAIIKIPFVVLQHINNLITESEKEKTSPSEQTIRVEPADKAENDEADSDGMEDAPSPEPTPAFTQAKTEYEMQLNHVANIVKTDPHILALLREVLKEIKESQVTPEKIRESVAARMKDHGIPAQQVLTESDVMTAKLKPIEADEHIKKLKRVAPVKGSQAHRKERKEKENRARMADPLLHSFLLPPTGSAQLPHRSMNLLPVPRRPQSINVAQSSIFQTQLPLFPQVEPPSPLSRPTSPATLDHSLHSHSLSSLSGDSPLFYGLSSMTPDSNSLSFGFFDSPSLTSRMINSPSFYTQPSYSPSASTFPYSLLSNMDDGAAFNLLPNASSNLNQAAKAQSITSPNFQLAFRSLGKIEKEDDGWD